MIVYEHYHPIINIILIVSDYFVIVLLDKFRIVRFPDPDRGGSFRPNRRKEMRMSLLKDERMNQIMEYLYQAGKVTVVALCEQLQVSPATIRRDLEELVAKDLVKRTHGGIMLPESAKMEPPVLHRRYFQAVEKRNIGKVAARLIHDDETVFLGSGSTVLEVAEYLRGKKNLTVITNSLPIIDRLAKDPDIHLVSTGGSLRQSELSLVGHLVETSLAELRADKVVMSIQGIHLQHGLTNNDSAETMIDRTICHFAPNLILVADHTKFNKTKASFVAELAAIHTVVTDCNAPADFLNALENIGIEVLIAEESVAS
jgi:DeoR/GlpR family transcriptional regulator of sugar metabolism